jgi:hypothetical protein
LSIGGIPLLILATQETQCVGKSGVCPVNKVSLIQVNDSHLLVLPTPIPLSRVGSTCFHHVVLKIRQLFLRPAACLTSTLPETIAGDDDCKCSQDQRLNVPSESWRSSK